MKGIDTNVLARYLTSDDRDQYGRAKAFITSECTTDDPATKGTYELRGS